MHGKLVLLVIFLSSAGYAIQVNEIMQNPSGSDTGREWVELYNNDSISYNITLWKLNTDNTDHSLNAPPTNGGLGSMLLNPGEYAIISQDAATFLSDYPAFNGTLIDSSWSDLSNSINKSIWLKNSTALFHNITYSPALEGRSFCEHGECTPTPGASNIIFANTTNSTPNTTDTTLSDARLSIHATNGQPNTTYSLFLIEIDNKTCSILENVTVTYNITPSTSDSFVKEVGCSVYAGNWTPSEGTYTICGVVSMANETNLANNAACRTVTIASQAPSSCNVSLSISAPTIVGSSQSFDYSIVLKDTACSSESAVVEYWIEDLFGVYAKEKFNTTQSFSCSKSVSRQWTPPETAGTEGYKIAASVFSQCDPDKSDNYQEKIIVVKGSQQTASATSTSEVKANIKTDSVYHPAGVFAGDEFQVSVRIEANETKHLSVYSYVYSGQMPVSEGFNGSRWSGSWDANKKDVKIAAPETIDMLTRIENKTPPGVYDMKIKIKGDEDREIKRTITVMERPKLEIIKSDNRLSVSTKCNECEIMVIGPGIDGSFKNTYIVENISGSFQVLLVKDSKIFSKDSISLSPRPQEKITGLVAAKKPKIKYAYLLQILARTKLF